MSPADWELPEGRDGSDLPCILSDQREARHEWASVIVGMNEPPSYDFLKFLGIME